MKCILKQCPHQPTGKSRGSCALLEGCGASVALEAARHPNGYEVCGGGNPTISALEKAGLVVASFIPGSNHRLVKAKARQSKGRAA